MEFTEVAAGKNINKSLFSSDDGTLCNYLHFIAFLLIQLCTVH